MDKLTHKSIKDIINMEFKFTPAIKAAALLYSLGVRTPQLNKVKMGEVKKSMVMNCLRDIEIKNKG